MSQELLYTSAPHGLKPGSRGFCTVLSTQGMAGPLAAALEGLSGYRPVYPPGDERHDLNPINWSHVTLQVAGRMWHLLSRVCEYGLDYSQRTNKLAHHVLLDSTELIAAGPAALLASPHFMRSEWDEEPHLVPAKAVPKIPPRPRGVCQAWKDLTGDGGWAGVLAEAFLRDPERPVILLYAPGQDMLPLIAEALSLIPADRRWELTFSTYFTGLPQGVGCTWRCMLSDSPEAHQSLRFVRALRLDLTAPERLGIASGGALVDDARGVPRLKTVQNGEPPALPRDRLGEDPAGNVQERRPPATDDAVGVETADDVPPLPGRQVSSARETFRPPNSVRPRNAPALPGEKSNQRKTIAIVAAGFGLVVILLIGLSYSIVKSLRSPRGNPLAAKQDADASATPVAKPKADLASDEEPLKSVKQDDGVKSKPEPVVPTKPVEIASTPPAPATPTDANTPKTATPTPANPNPAVPTPTSPPAADPKTAAATDLSPGRKKVVLNSAKKGAVTELGKLVADALPKRTVQLWAPERMFLKLKSNPGKTKYILTEDSAPGELGQIFWRAPKENEATTGPQRYELILVAQDSLDKFKRLTWGEIEIDNPTEPFIKVFHPFPIPREQNERRIEKSSAKDAWWGVLWTLPVKTDGDRLPELVAEPITLTVGEKQYDFQLHERTGTQENQQLRLKSDAFIKFIVGESNEKKGKRAPSDIFLQLVANVNQRDKDNDGLGSVVIKVILEGLQESLNDFEKQRKAADGDIAKLLKNQDLGKIGIIELNRAKLKNHLQYLQEASKEVARLKAIAEAATDTPMAKMRRQELLNATQKNLDTAQKEEERRGAVESALKMIRIDNAPIYYNLQSSLGGPPRPVYLFKDEKNDNK